MSKGLLHAVSRRGAPAIVSALLTAGTAVAALHAAPLAAAATPASTPEQVEQALSGLTPEQNAQLLEALTSSLDGLDFGAPWRAFAVTETSPLGFSIDALLGDALPVSLDGLLAGLNLLPSQLRYEWQTTVGGLTKTHAALLQVPSLLDVNGDARPDVIATLSISGTSSVTLSVNKLVLGTLLPPQSIPLRIEAIVPDPRGGAAKFAFGYDARGSNAPSNYSETVTIGGTAASTTVGVSITQSGAGGSMSLLASQFTGAATNRVNDLTLGVALAPVPANITASAAVGSTVQVNLGASQSTLATVEYVDYGDGEPAAVSARIDRLPSNLALSATQAGEGTVVSYAAAASVSEILVTAENVSGLGTARLATLRLAGVPTSMTLALPGAGSSFDIDTHGADLGQLEALLTSGPVETLPPSRDGVLLRDTPAVSLVAARITGLRRVSATQSPLSLFLDSTAGRPFRVDLREQASAGARETYTFAELSALARSTTVSIADGDQQRINYSAAAATGSLTLSTNAGDRDSLNASASPVPSNIAICAAGNNGCSSSGRPGNTASMRMVASQHMSVNLQDCGNASCSEVTRLTNLNVRLVDLSVDIGQSCTFLGCLPAGSQGSIWLDTDNFALSGTVRNQSSSFTVQAGFGSGFNANNRFSSWDFFVPSKSGSISCTSGTYLDVTVFGITIDVSGLYLC